MSRKSPVYLNHIIICYWIYVIITQNKIGSEKTFKYFFITHKLRFFEIISFNKIFIIEFLLLFILQNNLIIVKNIILNTYLQIKNSNKSVRKNIE